MKLLIPHYKQQRGMSCGLVAMRMLFDYLGDKVTEKELDKKTKRHSFGNFFTELGELALDKNYDVTCYTIHLSILGPLKLPFGKRIITASLKNLKIRPSDKMTLDSWKSYLKKGGKLIWDTPKISRIEEYLNNKTPCSIAINTAALRKFWRKWDNGHFLVVEGFDKDNFYVVDPDLPTKKAKYKINKDELLPSWAINASRSSAFLMVIERKK